MRRPLATLALLAATLAPAAPAHAKADIKKITIGFDDLANKTNVGKQYQSKGIIFGPGAGGISDEGVQIVKPEDLYNGGPTHSGAQGFTFHHVEGEFQDSTLDATLTAPATYFEVWTRGIAKVEAFTIEGK